MLKKISLAKFKSFSDMKDLELKNLTVVVGKNSCGKSSILQSLLLLKQTLSSSSNYPLFLEGKYLKLSNLKEISFGLPPVNTAKIGYTFLFESKNTTGSLEIEFKNKKIKDSYEIIIDKYVINVEKNDSSDEIDYKKLTTPQIRNMVEKYSFLEDRGTIVSHNVSYQKFIPDAIEITLENDEGKKNLVKLPIFILSDDGYAFTSELSESIKDIRYLSPVRAVPERAYVHYSQDVIELNEDGSNAAHILWSNQNKFVQWKGKKIKLKDAVNECIELMGLSQKISPDRIGDILYKVGIQESVSRKDVSLADVGFGYSQILPVIIMGLINNKNNLMLLEQPEIHLHPSSSANLADLFLSFVENDKRFIIETHSQEFINRLRLRVIENPSLKDKINIVFIETSNESGASIKQFSIDENGMFPEWPDGFLDESENIAKSILNARLSRK
ncbi:MAG: DUF3696 domain-containing protein [Flavobacteriaceae bacterium]|nr:DUF3696 domain-containing protein [Flavobacteriaceae bacterium]